MFGKIPFSNDKLIMFVIVGSRAAEHFLSRKVGSGSRSHCLSGDWKSSFSTSSSVTGEKVRSCAGGEGGGGLCGSGAVCVDAVITCLRLEILSLKNDAKRDGRSGFEKGICEGCLRCRSLFTVFQRSRGFPRDDATRSE